MFGGAAVAALLVGLSAVGGGLAPAASAQGGAKTDLERLLDCAGLLGDEERLACFDKAATDIRLGRYGEKSSAELEAEVRQREAEIAQREREILQKEQQLRDLRNEVAAKADEAEEARRQAEAARAEAKRLAEGGAPRSGDDVSLFGINVGFGGESKDAFEPSELGDAEVVRDEDGEIDSIRVDIKETRFDPLGQLIVELANGQVWKQIDSNRVRVSSLQPPTFVVIRRAALGSYLMQLDDEGRAIRVRRQD